MAERVQITPGLRPGSSARVDEDARARGLAPATLLRLALEEVWPSAPGGPATTGLLGVVEDTYLCPEGQWVQRVTSISSVTFERIEAERERRGFRFRSPLLRAAIERRYPPG